MTTPQDVKGVLYQGVYWQVTAKRHWPYPHAELTRPGKRITVPLHKIGLA